MSSVYIFTCFCHFYDAIHSPATFCSISFISRISSIFPSVFPYMTNDSSLTRLKGKAAVWFLSSLKSFHHFPPSTSFWPTNPCILVSIKTLLLKDPCDFPVALSSECFQSSSCISLRHHSLLTCLSFPKCLSTWLPWHSLVCDSWYLWLFFFFLFCRLNFLHSIFKLVSLKP